MLIYFASNKDIIRPIIKYINLKTPNLRTNLVKKPIVETLSLGSASALAKGSLSVTSIRLINY